MHFSRASKDSLNIQYINTNHEFQLLNCQFWVQTNRSMSVSSLAIVNFIEKERHRFVAIKLPALWECFRESLSSDMVVAKSLHSSFIRFGTEKLKNTHHGQQRLHLRTKLSFRNWIGNYWTKTTVLCISFSIMYFTIYFYKIII